MTNLEWFRTFAAIYECKNITEASKQLNMTQPGVSKHLLALENHIGKKLFDRTTRKLVPTEYGSFLYGQITSPLQELSKVEYYSGKRAKKPRSAIAIGCTTDFFKTELLHKIYAFNMYIVTHFGNENELIEALEKEQVQLLVGVKKYAFHEHLFTFLNSEELVLIYSNNIDIPADVKSDSMKLSKWLQKQAWFSFTNEQDDIKSFWEARFNQTPKIIPRYILPSYLNIIEAIKISEGFAVVPKHLCEQALRDHSIQSLENSASIEQKRFYSYKLKNNNLKEIKLFIENMNKSMN